MGASVERAMALFLERCVVHFDSGAMCLRLLGAIYVFVRLRSLVSRKDPCKSCAPHSIALHLRPRSPASPVHSYSSSPPTPSQTPNSPIVHRFDCSRGADAIVEIDGRVNELTLAKLDLVRSVGSSRPVGLAVVKGDDDTHLPLRWSNKASTFVPREAIGALGGPHPPHRRHRHCPDRHRHPHRRHHQTLHR